MKQTPLSDTQGHVNEPENTAQEMIDDVNADAKAEAAPATQQTAKRPAPKRKFRIAVGPLNVVKHYSVAAIKDLIASNPGTYAELILDGERFVFGPSEN